MKPKLSFKVATTHIISGFMIMVIAAPLPSAHLAFARSVPSQAIAYYQDGLQLRLQNPRGALADFSRAAILAPSWEPPVYEEGQLLAVQNFPAAIPVLLRAARLAPKDDTVWNILGWGYYAAGQFSSAQAAFQKQLAVAPGSPQAQWGLANSYANSAVRRFASARAYLQRLLSNPQLGKAAKRLLAQLPPNAIDLSVNPSRPITFEDAIASALSYRNGIMQTRPVSVRAENDRSASPAVAPYVTWAFQHGDLTGLTIPSFQAPATRLFVALLFAKLYGINQYDYLRPFPLTDIAGVSTDDAMTLNSILANRLLSVAAPNRFAPDASMSRKAYAAVVTNANSIMKHPPRSGQLLTPPVPTQTLPPWLYFFATSLPDINAQNADIAAHKTEISGIGLTYFPFIADFPQGSAKTRQQIDHTQYLLTAASAGTAVDGQLSLIQASGIKPFLVLANYNNVTHAPDPTIVHQMLQSASARAALVAEIVQIVKAEQLRGVTADFESMLAADRVNYVAFLKSLHEALTPLGVTTMVTLPERARDTGGQSAYDYGGLGQHADLVMLITYDEHTPDSKPGTIAALFNDDRVVKYALEKIPAQKILLGVADYGYDWSGTSGAEVSMQQAQDLATAKHAAVTTDGSSQTPTFSYVDGTGAPHIVWFENQQSLTQVDALVKEYGLAGIAVWHLGAENDGFWNAFATIEPNH